MYVLIDHLNAVIVGTVILVALIALQLRQQMNSIDETLRYELQTRGEAVMLTVGQDLDNVMTADAAEDEGLVPSRCRVERFPAGPVSALTCPGFIEVAPSVYEPGTVRYWMEAAGTTLAVGDSVRAAYTLHRDVSAPSGAASQPVAVSVVDLDVELFGATGTRVTAGDAPGDLTTLRVAVELAREGLPRLAGDQTSERVMNVARFGHTYRPPNLVYSE